MGASNKLSAAAVRAAKAGASTRRISDGANLYLMVKPTGAKSWTFMTSAGGRQREWGLGSADTVSLALARTRAQMVRDALATGQDPADVLRPRAGVTFREAALAYLEARDWTGAHRNTPRQWRRTLLEEAKALHSRPIAGLGRRDVVKVLKPMWTSTPETARRARGRLESLFTFAEAKGWREGRNPADRKLVEAALPPLVKQPDNHHAAVPYARMPEFMAELRRRKGMGALALEVAILTGVRSGMVRRATWDQFDLDARTWTVGAGGVKRKREHVIPLVDRVVDIVGELAAAPTGERVFPGARPGSLMSDATMAAVLKRMGYGEFTVHGFRATLRTWAGDCTTHPREVAERALDHTIGDRAEQAYSRGKMVERVRRLLTDWETYVGGEGQKGNVVPIHRAGR